MAEYEEKFFVLNLKHLSDLSDEARMRVEEAMECVSDELVEHNYYVCNQDEPYADDVITMILNGEDFKAAKKKMEDSKNSAQQTHTAISLFDVEEVLLKYFSPLPVGKVIGILKSKQH